MMRPVARPVLWLLVTLCAVPYARVSAHSDGAPPNTERTVPSHPASETRTIKRLIAQAATLPNTPPTSQKALVESTSAANFASASNALTARAIAALDAYVATLAGMQVERVLVSAHTDSQPLVREARQQFHSNLELSQARAASIVSYLEKALNLPESAFAIEGKGASQPIASNATPAGRAKNRRAILRVWARPPADEPIPAVLPQPPPAILNTASECIGNEATQLPPVRITVDGKPLDTREGTNEADRQRCVDVALARAEVQLRYDPLEEAPFLNTIALPQNAVPGESVRFATYTNYPRYIERAEIRVYAAGQSTQQKPLAVLAVVPGNTTQWMLPKPRDSLLHVTSALELPKYFSYVLRVYDREGRFDETKPRRIDVLGSSTHPGQDMTATERDAQRAVYGENALAVRNIPVSGGAITISGSHVPEGNHVYVQGMPVPVDDQQHFVARQILPRGPEQVTVRIVNDQGEGLEFTRNLTIAVNDSFFVGIADFTAGQHARADRSSLLQAIRIRPARTTSTDIWRFITRVWSRATGC